MIVAMLFLAAPATGPSCLVTKGVDINPHTAGIGWAPSDNVDKCCALCRSPTWWAKGCRFSTLSRGRCWFKGDNRTGAPLQPPSPHRMCRQPYSLC